MHVQGLEYGQTEFQMCSVEDLMFLQSRLCQNLKKIFPLQREKAISLSAGAGALGHPV